MPAIERIDIQGFKSIRDQSVELTNLNVLIGANGSGKSNFLGVFRFLRELARENLRVYVARGGGADAFLYYGRTRTDLLNLHVQFGNQDGESLEYRCSLAPAIKDTLVFDEEAIEVKAAYRLLDPHYTASFGQGHQETRLADGTDGMTSLATLRRLREAMESWHVYHSNNTADSATVKQTARLHDNRYLRPDAANLAPFLYYLAQREPDYYERIVQTVQLIAPFFRDFLLRPNPLNEETIRLEWIDTGSDAYFDVSALSDGTLRFIILATLLLQPPHLMPPTILLDEPEMGLHPAAIGLLGDLLRAAAQQTQVIVSTQSVTLVNQFDPDNLAVVERQDHATVIRRLAPEQLQDWLEDYSLGELWEKNVLGGRPTA